MAGWNSGVRQRERNVQGRLHTKFWDKVRRTQTYSKIGGALHLRFGKWGFNLDIDINPPNIPICNINQYDGSNWDKRQYLERTKPVGWLDEWMKSVNMQVANAYPESQRSVR